VGLPWGPSSDRGQDPRVHDQLGEAPGACGELGRGVRGARGLAQMLGPCAPVGDRDQRCAGAVGDLPSQVCATWDIVCAVSGPSIAEGPSAPLGSEEVEVDVQGVELLWATLVGLLWQEELQRVHLDASWPLVQVPVVLALPWALAPLAQQVGIVQRPLR